MPIPQEPSFFERVNAKERVLQTLSSWLVDGTLEPGERIYDETLSKYFHVSRTPVREALQTLSEKGLVEIVPGRGTRVAPIDLEDLRQIYPLLSHLHGFAVHLAFDRVTPEIIGELERRNEALRQVLAEGDLPTIREADQQFHQILISLAENKYLSAYLDDLTLHTDRTEAQFFKKSAFREQSVEGHEKIIAALRSGDREGAIQATEENWMLNFHLVLEALIRQQRAPETQ